MNTAHPSMLYIEETVTMHWQTWCSVLQDCLAEDPEGIMTLHETGAFVWIHDLVPWIRRHQGHSVDFGRKLEKPMVAKDWPVDISPQAGMQRLRSCLWEDQFVRSFSWTTCHWPICRQWLREDVVGLELRQAFAAFKATCLGSRAWKNRKMQHVTLTTFHIFHRFLQISSRFSSVLHRSCPCQAAWDSFRPTVEATRKVGFGMSERGKQSSPVACPYPVVITKYCKLCLVELWSRNLLDMNTISPFDRTSLTSMWQTRRLLWILSRNKCHCSVPVLWSCDWHCRMSVFEFHDRTLHEHEKIM